MSEREKPVGYVEKHDLRCLEAGSKGPVRLHARTVDPKGEDLVPVYVDAILREKVEALVRRWEQRVELFQEVDSYSEGMGAMLGDCADELRDLMGGER